MLLESGENKCSRTSSLDSAILVGKTLFEKSLVGKYLDEFGWDWTNPEPETGNLPGAPSGCAVYGVWPLAVPLSSGIIENHLRPVGDPSVGSGKALARTVTGRSPGPKTWWWILIPPGPWR